MSPTRAQDKTLDYSLTSVKVEVVRRTPEAESPDTRPSIMYQRTDIRTE